MFKFFKTIFSSKPVIEFLDRGACHGKTDQELIEKLKSDSISRGSGEMIVTELLDRIINR